MATEFDLIFDDFSMELDALTEMAGSSLGSAAASMTPRARIAAGNGATLLLAAVFEEYIRQQVRAAFRAKVIRSKDITEFPERIASMVWKRSLETLSRASFQEIESDIRRMDERIASIVSFCLKKDINADVGEALSRNENNMRTSQLNALFNSIGLNSMTSNAASDKDLIDYLGSEDSGKANNEIQIRIDDFFRRRNSVAHAIKLASSSGPSELQKDIELFRTFGRAISRKLNGLFETEIV